MKNQGNQRARLRYAPEKNISFVFLDLLLMVAGFVLTAVLIRGSWQLTSAEAAGMLLTSRTLFLSDAAEVVVTEDRRVAKGK